VSWGLERASSTFGSGSRARISGCRPEAFGPGRAGRSQVADRKPSGQGRRSGSPGREATPSGGAERLGILGVRAGLRIRGVEGESFRGARSPKEYRPSVQGNLVRCERTRRRIKASKWVRPTKPSGFALQDPEQPGGALRRAERELIVVTGTRQARASAGVGESGGDKVLGRAFVGRRRITTREHAASRGARDFCEGKALEGKVSGWLRHETRPRSLGLHKPLRGCENLRADRGRDWIALPHMELARGMSLRAPGISGESVRRTSRTAGR